MNTMLRQGLHHHDPFSGGRQMSVPPIASEPATGPCTILAVVDRYPPFVNAGAESYLATLLRDSVRRGHRAIVATGCVSERHVIDGVEVIPFAGYKEVIDDVDVAVTHLQYTNEAIRIASKANLPLVYCVHNDSQIRYWRLFDQKVSAYVWNSEWVGAKCSGWPEAANVPSTVIRPVLVADDFAVTDPAPSDREFVTLVNPIEAKGSAVFYALAEAFPERRFLAVEGAYGSQVRPKARHTNVEWQRQTGTFRDDVLARTRVLLIGSSYESWGLAAVEACAAGIPVIATPTPGLIEALGADWPYFAGFGDTAAWAEVLRRLDNPVAYKAASAGALLRAAELDRVGQLDLARWDRLVRMGARTTQERRDPAPAPGALPGTARDVAEWIEAGPTPEDRQARADRAWTAETSRKGGVRKTVADAVVSHSTTYTP